MKKFFLKSIFLLIIPLGIISYIIQFKIDTKLAKSNLSNYKDWNNIIESKINADLIIQGSSRAWVHISPYSIDTAFKLNSYNIGIDGFDFIMQYHRFRLYMEHNKKPEYILQIIDPFTLSKRKDLYMPEQFIPYLHDSIIRKAVMFYDGLRYADLYFPFLKYYHTSQTRELITQSLTNDTSRTYRKYKGFIPMDRNWDSDFRSFKKANLKGFRTNPDKNSQKFFEEFLKYCRENEIKLILVFPPEYTEAQQLMINRDSVFNLISSYAAEFKFPFIDYSSHPICNDTTLFYNSQHLNIKGVEAFNKVLISDLKSLNIIR